MEPNDENAPPPSPRPSVPSVGAPKAVERLFPFVLRTRTLLVGRDTLSRSKGKLHFILVTTDLSAKSREQVLRDFAHYPVVAHYASADLERFFGVKGAKVVGFAKSSLAQSLYAELKPYRINAPAKPVAREETSTPDGAAPG